MLSIGVVAAGELAEDDKRRERKKAELWHRADLRGHLMLREVIEKKKR